MELTEADEVVVCAAHEKKALQPKTPATPNAIRKPLTPSPAFHTSCTMTSDETLQARVRLHRRSYRLIELTSDNTYYV
jgi:hypothetical protein